MLSITANTGSFASQSKQVIEVTNEMKKENKKNKERPEVGNI